MIAIATRFLHQARSVVLFARRSVVSITRPQPETLELATQVAAAVPGSWLPIECEPGLGAVTIELQMPGGVVQFNVHGVPAPAGWVEEPAHVTPTRWLEAGLQVTTISKVELAALAAQCDCPEHRRVARGN